MNNCKKIKVLVVEDSSVKRELLVHILTADPCIDVIATADNGATAIEIIKKNKPDVVTMDIEMSGMDGFETAEKIMSSIPVPIVIVSALRNNRNKTELSKAMISAGALYFLDSPHGPWHDAYEKESTYIIKIVKLMSEIKTFTRKAKKNIVKKTITKIAPKFKEKPKLIVIGTSTGGPSVLNTILSGVSENFKLPIIIVQHIAPGFDKLLQHQLNSCCKLPVHMVDNGTVINGGNVYIAPGGKNLELCSSSKMSIINVPTDYRGNIPSIDLFFKSVKKYYGESAIAMLLSGMGVDGAHELKLLNEAGAVTIAQNQESCTVYGMPAEAVKLNAATYILSPLEIVDFLNKL